jgi:C1A family cysteine protease
MPFDPTQFALGWNPYAESLHAPSFAKLAKVAAPITVPIPDNVLPPLPINNQGPIGSCQGNAQAKVLEYDNWLSTKTIVKLSSRFAYLATKQTDGSLGQGDNGSSISGGAVTASHVGCCREETFPYWSAEYQQRYAEAMNAGRPIPLDESIDPAAFTEAKQHLLRSQCQIPDWDFGSQFIGSGQGGITFGINWYESLSQYNGQGVVTRVSGAARGGHALCICGYKTVGGQKIPGVRNSWGEEYGDGGTLWIDPDLLYNRLIREVGFGSYGFSGLEEFACRHISDLHGMGG